MAYHKLVGKAFKNESSKFGAGMTKKAIDKHFNEFVGKQLAAISEPDSKPLKKSKFQNEIEVLSLIRVCVPSKARFKIMDPERSKVLVNSDGEFMYIATKSLALVASKRLTGINYPHVVLYGPLGVASKQGQVLDVAKEEELIRKKKAVKEKL